VVPLVSILLPGLDGTAQLFEPFVAAAPAGFAIRSQPLPCERPRGYHELAEWVLERLPSDPLALIAESFSGPLALLVADRCPRVAAIVLRASFIESPLAIPFPKLPLLFWKRPPPVALLQFLLTGGNRELAQSMRRAIATVPGDVIADRVASALHVRVNKELDAFSRPLLCLRATRDRLVRRRSTEAIRATKPHAEFVDVDGPHLLLQSNPSMAWNSIRPFLERAASIAAP
jgi:pimeloyl-ACP methyl ester carboxylesterase